MSVRIRLPANMRPLVGNQSFVAVDATTVGEAFECLLANFPDLRARVMDGHGNLLSYINVFINEQNIREKSCLDCPVKAGDEILVIAALAGG